MAGISNGALRVVDPDSTEVMPERGVLPRAFLEWQRDSRMALFRTVLAKGGEAVRAMPAHLAVLGSVNPDGTVNMATKGFGMIPNSDRIEELTALFKATAERCIGTEWRATLGMRLDALMSFYSDIDNFDDSRLGGLEIFEGTTHQNLRSDPRASLLFSGEAPSFTSFHMNGTVEFAEKGDTYYNFLVASRELFSRDCFHIPQSTYPLAILFNVRTVRNKSPFSRM